MFIDDFIDKLESFDMVSEAGKLIMENKQQILEMNKDQLWAGENTEGMPIRPSYFEDPFFKTRQQARAYANWKQRITPNPKRALGTPNLFINGYYYNSQDLQVQGTDVVYTSTLIGGEDIDVKYRNIRGLTPINMQRLMNTRILPGLIKALNDAFGM